MIVFGDKPLRPAVVEAPYVIRAAVALYMVAASIPGRTSCATPGSSSAPIPASWKTSAPSAPRWNGQ